VAIDARQMAVLVFFGVFDWGAALFWGHVFTYLICFLKISFFVLHFWAFRSKGGLRKPQKSVLKKSMYKAFLQKVQVVYR
jgi:hypothetical protein